jgi:hypothetical protein
MGKRFITTQGYENFVEAQKMKKSGFARYEVKPPVSHHISVGIHRMLIPSILLIFVMAGQLRAESVMNFPDRKALTVDNCPYVRLSSFSFENRYERVGYRSAQSMAWTNVGGQSVIAFEIVILKYDAFNERTNGVRWTITGFNSQNWLPLNPGYTGFDTVFGLTTEEAFTCIAYVRSVRLKDGTVWRADTKELLVKLHEIAPDITAFGALNGEIKLQSIP